MRKIAAEKIVEQASGGDFACDYPDCDCQHICRVTSREVGRKAMETETTTESIIKRYPDAYNLGRAMSLIEGLLCWPDNSITRVLAEKFLEEMREEKS